MADARVHFLCSPLRVAIGLYRGLFLAANLLPQSVSFTLRDPFQLIPLFEKKEKEGERKKARGFIPACSIKTIISPWRASFAGGTTTRQHRSLTAGTTKTLFHLSRLIPTVTTDRSINTRPHYQKMKMAVARSMRNQYLCGSNAAPR